MIVTTHVLGATQDNLRGRRVLVTGASGSIGAAVTAAVRRVGCRVRVTGRSGVGLPQGHNIEAVRADLADPAQTAGMTADIDVIFHLAGSTRRARTPSQEAGDAAVNVGALSNLLDDARRCGRRPVVVMAGSETQCGSTGPLLSDATPDAPNTPYDLHKCLGEQYLFSATSSGDVRGVSLRLPSVYGARVSERAVDRGVATILARRAWAGEPLLLYGGGHYLRDFLHVDDVANAFLAATLAAGRVCGDHFLVASGDSRSIREVAVTIVAAVRGAGGPEAPLVDADMPAHFAAIDTRSIVIDDTRFRERTGWRPQVSFEGGIAATVQRLSPSRTASDAALAKEQP
jgi:nucleoside-diphosphate-sugar epimerase